MFASGQKESSSAEWKETSQVFAILSGGYIQKRRACPSRYGADSEPTMMRILASLPENPELYKNAQTLADALLSSLDGLTSIPFDVVVTIFPGGGNGAEINRCVLFKQYSRCEVDITASSRRISNASFLENIIKAGVKFAFINQGVSVSQRHFTGSMDLPFKKKVSVEGGGIYLLQISCKNHQKLTRFFANLQEWLRESGIAEIDGEVDIEPDGLDVYLSAGSDISDALREFLTNYAAPDSIGILVVGPDDEVLCEW